MAKKVPSLSSSGWLTELSERADRLMAYYLTSEYSQTHLYKGQVTSLTYHVSQYGNNADKLKPRVQSSLESYLMRYFDKVEVEVRTDLPDVSDPDRINLRLDINVYEDGFKYNLGREIKTEKSKVVEIFDLNNAGVA